MTYDPRSARTVHFILNSKGGVGKSFVAFLLAQYYRQLGEPLLSFDADATTATSLKETLNDLDELAKQLPYEVEIVVWLNEHFGLIKEGGKTFRDMAVYKAHAERIRGVVHLPLRTPATFGEDVKEMVKRHLTFEEAIGSPEFTLMAKQRLRLIEGDVRAKLSVVL